MNGNDIKAMQSKATKGLFISVKVLKFISLVRLGVEICLGVQRDG